MSLANLQLRTEVVRYHETDITLHGLSANDIAGLILSQMGNLEEIFDIVQAAGVNKAEDLAKINVADVGQRLMVQLPDFIAHAIAYAAREPDQWHKVMLLDAPTQIKCLKAIASLTFNDEAGFREFVGNVVAALRGARAVVPQPNGNLVSSASLNGGSASEQPSLSS